MSPAASRYSATVRTLFRELDGAGDLAGRRREGRERRGRRARSRRLGPVRGAHRRLSGSQTAAFGHLAARTRWRPHRWWRGACAGRRSPRLASIGAAGIARELDAPAEKMGRLLVVEDALRALLADLGRVQ